MTKKKYACPSGTNSPGGALFGIVNEKGIVAFLPHIVPLNEELLSIGKQLERPEKVFRYTNKCIENGCRQWSGEHCTVLDNAKKLDLSSEIKINTACAIKNNCRWHFQEGEKACKVCPLIVADFL
jgi:hypothetical protein